MTFTLPTGINHLAVATDDMKATLTFYAEALGLPLSGLFWMHGVAGAIHAFCEFPDGRMLSFIQFAQPVPRPEGVSHAASPADAVPGGTTQHVALEAPDLATLDQMRERLKAHGVKVSRPVEHGFCTSIYFAGPDDVQLEITVAHRRLDEREIDAEVVERCGISAAELERLRHPDGVSIG